MAHIVDGSAIAVDPNAAFRGKVIFLTGVFLKLTNVTPRREMQ
jgi:hypothetical protein